SLNTKMKLKIEPKKILAISLSISIALVLLHIAFWTIFHIGDIHQIIFMRELFDLELEVSIPTWYAQVLLLTAAVFAGLIMVHYSKVQDSKNKRHWLLVALLCLFLSV